MLRIVAAAVLLSAIPAGSAGAQASDTPAWRPSQVRRSRGALTASLSDDDGSVTNPVWRWQSSFSVSGPFTDIALSADAEYRPRRATSGSTSGRQ